MLLKIATNLLAQGRGRGRGQREGEGEGEGARAGTRPHPVPRPRPYDRMTVPCRTAYRMYGKIGKYGRTVQPWFTTASSRPMRHASVSTLLPEAGARSVTILKTRRFQANNGLAEWTLLYNMNQWELCWS
eukprot:358250-Chlamydomonas_euryale.AAC.1